MSRFRFTEGERHVFRRLPPIPVSAWAAENLVVPDGPHAGSRWRADFAPYTVGIMDAWAEPWTEEVVVRGAPQTGKTLLMYACLCYAVARRPGPRMLAMPDDAALSKMLESKLRPMFRRTPAVRRLLRKIRAGVVLFRDGSAVHLASAQSPSQRASVSIMDLFLDEEDLFQSAGAGAPVLDFLERTRSYSHKRKIMRVSKPVGGAASSICRATEEVDELRRYAARCPACGTYQPLEASGLVCADATQDPLVIRRERLGRYRCRRCGYLWTDHLRDVAVAAGGWRAETPIPRPRSVGYHLPAILSRAVSLSEILAAHLRQKGSDDPALIRAYRNGYWAEPYEPVIEQTDAAKILDLRDPTLAPRTVPRGAVALTAGIDMQKRGFWYAVYAWTPALAVSLVDYGRLLDWPDVAALIWETAYPREEDPAARLPIWRAAVDTGGTRTDVDVTTRTEEAYDFVRREGRGRLFAAKGASHAQTAPVSWTVLDKMPRSHAAIPGGLQLFRLDTGYFKALVHARLDPEARQPIRLHAAAEASYADQLSAERLVRDKSGNGRWERIRRDNHYLDCTVMAFAAANASWTPSLQYLAQAQAQAQAEMAAAAANARRTPAPAPAAANPYTGEEEGRV